MLAFEVPQFWVTIRSKDLISTGPEVGSSPIEVVTKNQLVLRVLGDSYEHGDRRRLWFRDAVAVLYATKYEDWFNFGFCTPKGFLKIMAQQFISYDQVDVNNLARVKQIVHHII